MKTTFLQFGLQKMLFEVIENLLNCINIISFVDIDRNIIQVNNHKNFWFFCQYLIDILLKAYVYIGKAKRYHLTFQMTVSDIESRFPHVFLANFYLMINTDQIKLGKLLSPT